MKKEKGFTLIELLIILSFVGILAGLFFTDRSDTVCIAGYQHVVSVYTGNYTQLIDNQGHGIPCH